MELVPIKAINSVEVFEKGGLQSILDKIEKRAKSFVPDLSRYTHFPCLLPL